MPTQIFVNLPVKDLNKSTTFFRKLDFTFDANFTDEAAACMKIGDNIFAMLLTHAKFKEFTTKAIADATKTTEVLTCLALESRAAVDRLVDAAVRAGATEDRGPMDYGFMYGRSFDDLDGHVWELIHMDEKAAPQS